MSFQLKQFLIDMAVLAILFTGAACLWLTVVSLFS